MFYYKPTRNGQWRWTFISSNGQMSASHEMFPSRSNAKRAAYNFIKAAATECLVMDMHVNFLPLKEFKMYEWAERPGAK